MQLTSGLASQKRRRNDPDEPQTPSSLSVNTLFKSLGTRGYDPSRGINPKIRMSAMMTIPVANFTVTPRSDNCFSNQNVAT